MLLCCCVQTSVVSAATCNCDRLCIMYVYTHGTCLKCVCVKRILCGFHAYALPALLSARCWSYTCCLHDFGQCIPSETLPAFRISRSHCQSMRSLVDLKCAVQSCPNMCARLCRCQFATLAAAPTAATALAYTTSTYLSSMALTDDIADVALALPSNMDGPLGGTIARLVSPLATSAVGVSYLAGLFTYDITCSIDLGAVR
jgi:hypothetical protein